MIGFIASILAAAAGGIVGADRPLTVSEVLARHAELDGKVIEVQGFVLRCEQLGCSLRGSAEPAVKIRGLSLGGSQEFDAEVREHLGKRLVLQGRLNATCFRKYVLCMDRPTELENPIVLSAAR